MASFLYGRSSHREMKVPPPPSESSERRPRKTHRKRLFGWFMGGLAITLVLAFLLFTPPGQRWMVRKVLAIATSSLGPAGDNVELELTAVDLAWSPLGMSLSGFELQRTEDDGSQTPLVSLSELVLLPADGSGKHWLTIAANGLDISAAGTRWLTHGTASSDTTENTPTADLSVAELDLRNVRVALPDSWATSRWSHEILVEHAVMKDFDWQGEWPAWSGTSGQVLLMSRERASDTHDTTLIAWEEGSLPFTLSLSTHPEFWLGSTEVPDATIAACPASWTAILSRADSTLSLSGTADWGTLEMHASLCNQGMRLDTAHLKYNRHPMAWPEEVPRHGDLLLEGPIVLPLEEETTGQTLDWKALLGRASLTYTHQPKQGKPCQANVQWDLESGGISSEGDWYSAKSGQTESVRFTWSTEGEFAPLPAVDFASLQQPAHLGGTWSAYRGGNQTGALTANGTLELSAVPDLHQGTDVHWDLNARTAPLLLTEGLELYGGWGTSGEVKVDHNGGIDSWWGHVDLNGARFIPLPGFDGRQRQGAPLSMQRFHARGRGDRHHFEVDLEGDVVEGHIDGPNALEAWKTPLLDALVSGEIITKATAARWGSKAANEGASPSDWTANLTVWRDDLLERYSHGQWSIGRGSHVEIQHRNGEIGFLLDLRPLHLGDFRAHNLILEGSGGKRPMAWQFYADSVRHNQWGVLEELTLSADVELSSGSEFRASWNGTIPVDLALVHHLKNDNIHVVVPKQLNLSFAGATWSLSPGSAPKLEWQNTEWTSMVVDDLRLNGREGLLTVQSKNTSSASEISVQLDRLPLAPWLSMLGPPLGLELPEGAGLLHAAFDVALSSLAVKGAAQWEDAQLEGFDLGDLCLSGAWGEQPKVEFQQFQGEEEILSAQMVTPRVIDVEFSAWPLEQLQPLFTEAGVGLIGTTTGGLTVQLPENGAPVNAQGNLAFDAQEVFIGATGVTYRLGGDLDFSKGLIGMDRGLITDPNGQNSLLNISVLHAGFTDWNYDLGLELPEDFMVMDLAPDRSKLFYGTVLATGDANVFGTSEYMSINVDARSAGGTQFTMPLDAMDGPGIPSGIRFVGGSDAAVEEAPSPPPFDLSMELEIEVTPEAELSLVLDQQAGERVDGRAQGALSFVSNRNQSLTMEGGIEILEGQYRFSLRDLFSKTIGVAPGGRIDWDGNPYEAQLDLLAIAPLKASPAPLLPGLLSSVSKTEVEVGMAISGELSSPNLDFSIAFPTYAKADPELLAQVQPALATPEETQRQAFALLAAGQFIPSSQIRTNTLGLAAAAAQATDLVSTGVSELLSSLSEDVNIGLRYLPSTTGSVIDPNAAQTEDLFEMDLGLNLLNDRLKISGTLGARSPDGLQVDPENFTRAIDLRYQLTADGRWELMGYSKPESDLENDENYRYGLGAVYQVRFDHLRDLFRKSETP